MDSQFTLLTKATPEYLADRKVMLQRAFDFFIANFCERRSRYSKKCVSINRLLIAMANYMLCEQSPMWHELRQMLRDAGIECRDDGLLKLQITLNPACFMNGRRQAF